MELFHRVSESVDASWVGWLASSHGGADGRGWFDLLWPPYLHICFMFLSAPRSLWILVIFEGEK